MVYYLRVVSNKQHTTQMTRTTLAGISTDQIKAILTIAQNLQRNYDTLGASGHQNVRNPMPMRSLILCSVPRGPKKAMTRVEVASKLRSIGYKIGSIHFCAEFNKLIRGGLIQCVSGRTNAHSARFFMVA